MKKVIQLAALGACMVASSATHADGLYVGFNYSSGALKVEAPASDWNPIIDAVGLRLGKYITDNIAIEGRYSFLIRNYVVSSLFSSTPPEVETRTSVFAKADYGISDSLIVYGLVGYASGEIPGQSNLDAASSEKGSGVSYGVGVSYAVFSRVNLYAEHVHYYKDKTSGASPVSYNYEATNVGITYSF